MPRYARLHYPGGVFHIISRCLNREFLIQGEEDRRAYLGALGAVLARSDASLLGWALMSNHVHLVVRAGELPLAALMKPINTSYAAWKNRRGRRLGPVFAGRFSSPLVEEEAYLLELIRYIHNNPVRAGVVERAEDSDWTSHRCYLGLRPVPEWLETRDVLERFSADPGNARAVYARFVDEGAREGQRLDLAGVKSGRVAQVAAASFGDAWRVSQPVVGTEAFAAKVFNRISGVEGGTACSAKAGRKPELGELVAYTCGVLGLEPWEFEHAPKARRCQRARRIVTWLWVRVFDGTQAEVARFLHTFAGRVSAWYQAAVMNLPELEADIDAVLQELPEASLFSTWKTTGRIHYQLAIEQEPGGDG
jgi:REP element-mobilizing transposase RayT